MAKCKVYRVTLTDYDVDELMILVDKEVVSLSDILAVFKDNNDMDLKPMARRLRRIKKVQKTLREIR